MKKTTIIQVNEPASQGNGPVRKEELYRADAHDFNVVQVQPGMGKPPHPYDAGDSFMLITAGLLNLVVDGETLPLGPGQLALIPQGVVRGFTAGPEGATFFAAHLRS